MRFKLSLKPIKNGQHLLFNYQYPLQAWIYKLLDKADSKYVSFLHSKGYEVPDRNKSFKHFTFSSLIIPRIEKPQPGDAFMVLRSEEIFLIVSFYIEQAAERFIIGLFQNQALSLYNKDYQADFIVERVETISLVIPEGTVPTVRLRTLSPMVIAEKTDNMDQYLPKPFLFQFQHGTIKIKKELPLYITDAFGCLHNSSPDGGCQYWHGGKEMCQFFYSLFYYWLQFFKTEQIRCPIVFIGQVAI